jgi:hypothetical protein
MVGAFVGARRSLLVTKLAQVPGVQLMKCDDVLGGGRLAVDTVDRRKRFPCLPDSETRDPRDVVVDSHDTSRIPGLGFA